MGLIQFVSLLHIFLKKLIIGLKIGNNLKVIRMGQNNTLNEVVLRVWFIK